LGKERISDSKKFCLGKLCLSFWEINFLRLKDDFLAYLGSLGKESITGSMKFILESFNMVMGKEAFETKNLNFQT